MYDLNFRTQSERAIPLWASLQQVVPITFDSHHERQRSLNGFHYASVLVAVF
ncbi:MAG: hypothetical protein KBC94_00435 [Pseudacidovorax sp.]|uniref:hypothetical protein n=1 Tax=Pseudacidovorax sp. TaxID=1934311 RepID=UPI001B63990C|nr:hypothetical protein [Pseudacidovorax sp.]MBP6892862.1 hypothetical protein [Pseudacidovorax sp.]